MRHGACKDMDPLIFFPPSGSAHLNDSAKRICGSCIHRQECLDYAVVHGLEHGVWGGTSGKERRSIIRARNRVLRLENGPERPTGLAHG